MGYVIVAEAVAGDGLGLPNNDWIANQVETGHEHGTKADTVKGYDEARAEGAA